MVRLLARLGGVKILKRGVESLEAGVGSGVDLGLAGIGLVGDAAGLAAQQSGDSGVVGEAALRQLNDSCLLYTSRCV